MWNVNYLQMNTAQRICLVLLLSSLAMNNLSDLRSLAGHNIRLNGFGLERFSNLALSWQDHY